MGCVGPDCFQHGLLGLKSAQLQAFGLDQLGKIQAYDRIIHIYIYIYSSTLNGQPVKTIFCLNFLIKR